ncbi:unnamed protein product [Adineta steineri]|uniref:Uncharacterized protein n=1 Tax=Adineta steineri TaxID=433720 RepID=A0A813R780_9BILA|nr:unnamed protein product [Adineta steineri]
MMNRFGDIDVSFKRLPPVYGYRSEKLVSIEKALQPIEPQIDELPYYIKIAKQHRHFPSEHGLTKDQSAAVYIYTMEWGETTLYRVLNKALRSENRQALKIWFPYLKLFDTALDKLPTVKEVLWRGVPLDVGKNYTKNQLMTWWSINSCSSSANVIKSINGKKISGYTEYENEDEIILRMGTRFRVKCDTLEQSNGSHIVHLVEIDDENNDEPLSSAMNEMHVTPKPSTMNEMHVTPQSSAKTQMHVTSKPSNQGASGQPTRVSPIYTNTKWKQHGITIAGGNGLGNQLNQLHHPFGIYVDDDHQTIYITNRWIHRVVEWKYGAKNGQIVVAMDNNGDLYVSDYMKNEVRRWKQGETEGTIVAGGNGEGNHLNQLHDPTHIFVDEDHSIYVSDFGNQRVMKWMKGAKEGIVIAGGNGNGNSLTQLSSPYGVTVDHSGNVYVADHFNNRIMRWCKGSKEGSIVVGGNGQGEQSNQFNHPTGISFDVEGSLYVADYHNRRIQKFEIDDEINN